MIQPATKVRLRGSALYMLSALILMFFKLLPLNPGTIIWPGPDLMLALTLAWVLRRPDQLPALVIVITMLVGDLVLLRPLGLWTALVLMGSEAARSREVRWRDQSFPMEWLRAATLVTMIMLGQHLVMLVFLLEVPPFGMLVLHLVATVIAYPLVVLFSRYILGLRKMSLAEAGRLGYL